MAQTAYAIPRNKTALKPWIEKWFVIVGRVPWHVAKLKCRQREDGDFDVQHPEGPIITIKAADIHDTEAKAEQALLFLVMDVEE